MESAGLILLGVILGVTFMVQWYSKPTKRLREIKEELAQCNRTKTMYKNKLAQLEERLK